MFSVYRQRKNEQHVQPCSLFFPLRWGKIRANIYPCSGRPVTTSYWDMTVAMIGQKRTFFPVCYIFRISFYLNNYFDFHVCLSIRGSVVPSFRGSVCPKTNPKSCSLSQNVIIKSYLVCVKSEKYASWVTLRPQWDCCRRGKAEVLILDFMYIQS